MESTRLALELCAIPWYLVGQQWILSSSARPIKDISIEFEVRPKLAMLRFKIYVTDHNEILRQCNCRNVCQISLWSVEHIFN